jgi:hypothetical protein
MADNVAITAGAGTSIATDDCGAGGHAQIVKLAIATDGSATLIPAVAADGLLVNLGTNNDVTVTGTVTEASGAAIKTAVEILDNAISGSEMQVDVVAALPAGTNCIGGAFLCNDFRTTDNVYSAVIIASAAGASKNHLSIWNADAALKVDILNVYVTKEATAAATGLIRGHRLFRFTGIHSAGTTPTVRQLDTTMGALDADITVRAASSLSAAETEPLAAVGVGEEETATTAGRLVLFDFRETARPITLNQDQGVTVQQDATAGTGLVSVGILFRVR